MKINGAPYHGLDSNHWFIPLPPGTAGGELQLEIELYDPVPEPEDPLNRQAVIKPPLTEIEITLVRVNPSVFSLLHTVKIVHEAALLLPEGYAPHPQPEGVGAGDGHALYEGGAAS